MKKKKSNSNNKHFLLLLFYMEKFIFYQKTYLKKLSLYSYICTWNLYQFFLVAGHGKCSNKTPTPIQICIGFVDDVLQPKILGNRLGILTTILIGMDYFFIYVYFREASSIQKKQIYLLGKVFGSPHTSYWVYLLRNCFSNYVYLKDTLKGIGKILLCIGVTNFANLFVNL